jgi:hypothetical protein
MNLCGGMEVILHVFLTLELDKCEWPASRPGHYIPMERVHGIQWIGGWVDYTASKSETEFFINYTH